MKRLFVIGLTGPTGAGKSTVAHGLEAHGVRVLDCDKIARGITIKGSPVNEKLAQAFGEDIITPDGGLDRKLLAQRAFSTPGNTKRLNEITHPAIKAKISAELERLSAAGAEIVLLDAPTLFEAGADVFCDFIVCVSASQETRLSRIIARDSITEKAARLRMVAQKPAEYYAEKSDFTVTNEPGEDLTRKINLLLKKVEEARDGI